MDNYLTSKIIENLYYYFFKENTFLCDRNSRKCDYGLDYCSFAIDFLKITITHHIHCFDVFEIAFF